MKSEAAVWPELPKVFENLLCERAGLARPLRQHGKLLDSLNTLVNALSPSIKKKDEVYRQPDRSKFRVIELDWQPLAFGTDSRNRVRINPAHIPLLWNAILLQGVFGEPKFVVEFLSPTTRREPLVNWAKDLFLERQSLAGLGLLRHELMVFLNRLPDADLYEEYLPNPFADALPQMGIGDLNGNLLKALATQTAALSLGDSMMALYLSGDLEEAFQRARNLETHNALLQKYRDLIVREYEEASAFDELLDSLRKN
ncbi:hypothetical protein ACOXVJ_15165 [Pseudomonas knackmussii]|uniref:hypothetical protein n=1 Tax=Pseudomonas knackmussii TaxID=65741 RepID=UPI003BD96AF4